MELTITGTPAEVSPVIAQANANGHPVDVTPIGGGQLRVTVEQGTRPTRGHVPQPRYAAVPDVTARPMLPRVLWIAGGTGGVAVVGGVVVLWVLDPAALGVLFVLAVLVCVCGAYVWDRTKSAVADAIKSGKG